MKNFTRILTILFILVLTGCSFIFKEPELYHQSIKIDGILVESLTTEVLSGSNVQFDEKLFDKITSSGYDPETTPLEDKYIFEFFVNGEKVDNIDEYIITSDIEIDLKPIIKYIYITQPDGTAFDGEADSPEEIEAIVLPDDDGKKFCGWRYDGPITVNTFREYIGREIVKYECYVPIYQSTVTFMLDGKEICTLSTDENAMITPPDLGSDYVIFGWIKEEDNEGEMYSEDPHGGYDYIYYNLYRTYDYFDFENTPIYKDTIFIANAIQCTKISLNEQGATREGYWTTPVSSISCEVGKRLDFSQQVYLWLTPCNKKLSLSTWGKYSNCKFFVDNPNLVDYDEEGYMIMKEAGTTKLTINFGELTTDVTLNIVNSYGNENASAYGY